MARGIHDVDFHVFILNGGILGQNGDPPLPLQIAGVHYPVHHLLILPVHAALLEHLVYKGRLTVVDMGNNGHVSQFFILHTVCLLLHGRAAGFDPCRFRVLFFAYVL